MSNLNIIILAGGLGKRMNSSIPKVLHKVNEIPMLVRILQEANKLNPNNIFIIVGKYKDIIEKTISEYIDIKNSNIIFVLQETPMGSGHAVICCREELLKIENKESRTLILCGDTPLIQYKTLDNFVNINSHVNVMVTKLDEPFGYGRIIEFDNKFLQIKEEKDCDLEEKNINKVNCGMYVIRNDLLCKYLPYITNNNSQNEYYLTDIIEIIKKNEKNIDISMFEIVKEKQIEILGVNTIDQLKSINEKFKL
jgi:UDP-N-acetylglucosamine diphosphorylase/glucosamine-1-phosphate N-acetyltransferase